MFGSNLSTSGTMALTAVAAALIATTASAEPYGGFDSVERKYIRIDYGPRFQTSETTIKYVDPPGPVSFRRTYTRPAVTTTKVVYEAPVVEYVAPVRFRRAYTAPRRVLHVSPVVRFGGHCVRHRPRVHYRHHGLLGHFRPHRCLGHYRHRTYRPHGWGFSINMGGGYHGHRGHHGGFSFFYDR